MDDPVAQHLAWLRLSGQSEGSVYARGRALARLQAWLACYGDQSPGPAMVRGENPRRPATTASETAGPGLLGASAADLAAWRAALTVAPNTVVLYAVHVRGFYNFAVAQGWIESNPVLGLPLPRRVRGLPRPCGEDELMTAVQTAPRRIRPWLVLAGWAGLRAKEIALLERPRVLDRHRPPVIHVAADATKGRRERVVPCSPFVLAELRAYGLPRTGYVFERRDSRPGPNTPATVSHLANEHLAASGADCTLHQLRHRFASQLYQQTHDLRLVQEMLGHRSPESTAVYAAWDRAGAADAVAALPAPPRLRVAG